MHVIRLIIGIAYLNIKGSTHKPLLDQINQIQGQAHDSESLDKELRIYHVKRHTEIQASHNNITYSLHVLVFDTDRRANYADSLCSYVIKNVFMNELN